MTTWFVTRHPGAVLWARGSGIQVAEGGIVRDLDVGRVEAGDLVVGTLPINLAAAVAERGARYLHLALEVPPEARGRELSADEMRAFGARLEEYDIRHLGAAGVNNESGTAAEVVICIASGQPLASLLPLFMRTPTAIHVVESAEPRARRTSQRLQEIAAALGLPVTVDCDVPSAPLAAVESYSDQMLKRLRQRYPGARLVLNATGGTKLMSLGIANRIGPVGEVIYCDTENDRIEYFAPAGRPALTMPADLMNLQAFMLVQGMEIIRAASADSAWMANAHARIELSRALAGCRHENAFGQINDIAYRAEEKVRKGRVVQAFQPVQELRGKRHADVEKLFDRIAEFGLWTRQGETSVCVANEEAVSYLKGGWLEELAAVEVAHLCARAGIPDGHWAAGVQIRPKAANSAGGKPFNEIDLMVVWRNRLLVIECKTGTQTSDSNEGMNIINKLEAIGHYLGGPFSSTWLASARSVQHNSMTAERCRHFGVQIVDPRRLAQIGSFVAGWMGLGEAQGGRTDWVPQAAGHTPRQAQGANGKSGRKQNTCAGAAQPKGAGKPAGRRQEAHSPTALATAFAQAGEHGKDDSR